MWKRLQRAEWKRYQERGAKGVFSHAGHPAAKALATVIGQRVKRGQRLLDVGCGCLPLPAYLAVAHWKGVEIVGVDPFKGDTKREFEFHQGIGEKLPFDDASFDAVVFATSIDHMIEPVEALAEARRVTVDGGLLFIWFSRRWGPAYERWKKAKGPALFNKLHQWAFTEDSMRALVEVTGFEVTAMIRRGQKNRFLIAEARATQ